jgi:hypothetical protein
MLRRPFGAYPFENIMADEVILAKAEQQGWLSC